MAAPLGLSHISLITSTFLSPKGTMVFMLSAVVLPPSNPRIPTWPFPLFRALPAATDVLSATGGDQKTPGAGDPTRGPGQTVGTGDQKLADELRMVLSRGLCPPCPQGHHLAPWGGPEPNHESPKNNHYFYIFYQKMKLDRRKIPVGRGAVFLFAFLKHQCLNWLFLHDTLPSVWFCL